MSLTLIPKSKPFDRAKNGNAQQPLPCSPGVIIDLISAQAPTHRTRVVLLSSLDIVSSCHHGPTQTYQSISEACPTLSHETFVSWFYLTWL